ncbi:cytochrome P450 52A12 [Clohesyomyces aquaticus]|uniref:Cytochrome P450 52A12 n=1 Tax=Clohesyomyces aquaticus TaxID=1231657 RepID=A0A1Y2A2I7_9PLEO|nr:cytochrome P450 52A12 [Clohesyomyces aquaticus]
MRVCTNYSCTILSQWLRKTADYIFEDMVKTAGRPDILLVDIRPVGYAMVIVNSHEVAEQIAKPTKTFPMSTPKSPTFSAFLRLVGPMSILSQEGETWKSLRKRFNPGFAPQHLVSLLPQILQKTSLFMSKLDALAESDVEFDMEPLCTNLTFDIIGAVVMNVDLGAQDKPSKSNPIVTLYKAIIETYSDNGRFWLWLNLPVRIRRLWYYLQLDKVLKKALAQQFEEIKAAQRTSTKQTKDRSVLALALEDTDVLTKEVLQSTADQVKTFLFAGHDTTSILLQRLFHALSIHPKCLTTIRAEQDAVFGDRDPQDVFREKPDETMKALSYTSACIKEALRLWPPAGSARMAPPGSGFNVHLSDGSDVCVDGTVLYLCHYMIQRDPRVYGETADDFVPERWIGDTDTSSANKDLDATSIPSDDKTVPISAWRAFERGPRNCIGQELANLEARVILACVMRRYDFIKVGAGAIKRDEQGNGILSEKGVYETTSELFSTMQVTSKPFDKTRMRVKMHQK